MGHLLSTTNPEAAARLQEEGDKGITKPVVSPPAPAPAPAAAPPQAPVKAPYDGYVPEVGEIVHYHARPGEGRAGKTIFPAMVLHFNEREGTTQLAIFYAADDVADRIHIPNFTEKVPWPAWSPITSPLAARIDTLEERLLALEGRRGPGRPTKGKADEDDPFK